MSESPVENKGGRAFNNGMHPDHQDYVEFEGISQSTGTPVDKVGGPPLGDVPESPIPPQD